MKIINEETIYSAAREYAEKPENLFWGEPKIDLAKSFIAGYDFSETEIQNLAIEFAEWILENCETENSNWIFYEDSEHFGGKTTSELFTKFITERKK